MSTKRIKVYDDLPAAKELMSHLHFGIQQNQGTLDDTAKSPFLGFAEGLVSSMDSLMSRSVKHH